MAGARRGVLGGGAAQWMIFFSVLFLQLSKTFQSNQAQQIDGEVVQLWGDNFGSDLWESLSKATRREEIQQGYDDHEDLSVEEVDGFNMIKEMAEEVENMLHLKIQAIERISETAENIALSYLYDQELGEKLKAGGFSYNNAKKVNVLDEDDEGGGDEYSRYLSQYRDKDDEYYSIGYSRMVLTANKHFDGIPVNTSFSTVHVPTNVFDGEPKVINAIDWSRKLDETFKDNYEKDPSLSWQYFGSSTGFLRQYPAMKWLEDSEEDPDMYDARMRDWYIKAAASPKDIVILLDTSGSMTGLRKEIANHVVINIMETLGEDDFVTVLTFSDETNPLVDCFTDDNGEPELVQATNENIAVFTDALEDVETNEIANFTSALSSSFTLLERYRNAKAGAEANQAILLVTDGIPYKYENVFKEYNPEQNVRVFTYLIGRDVNELAAAKWIACENKGDIITSNYEVQIYTSIGYFAHVTTMAEVKEQVLKYIPVMARPLVLYRKDHPVKWTGVYADIEVPNQRSLWVIGIKKPLPRRRIREMREIEEPFTGYKLMTSVSIPVYNKKNHTTIEVLGLKPNELANPFGQVRIAELLGVAGTDVAIEDIEKLIPPYKLGVNGYSFGVNNNGHILYHQDLRPTFQELLKPNYNSVDFAEVELVYNEEHDEPRYNDSTLYNIRKEMVDQKEGEGRMKVKVHMDNMKRVTVREQDYFYYSIENTPFTLGIALPDKYGKFRVEGGKELNNNERVDVDDIFPGDQWKLHPDWVYCEYNYGGAEDQKSDNPEKNMRHFLERLADERSSVNWDISRVKGDSKCQGNGPYTDDCPRLVEKRDVDVDDAEDEIDEEFDPIINKGFCDKDLVEALVLDAEITKIFVEENSRSDLFDELGVNLAFVATRSGLTRWEEYEDDDDEEDYAEDEDNGDEDGEEGEGGESDEEDDDANTEVEDPDVVRTPHFSEVNNEATDEVWYKRAVEYHLNNPDSFVFSVPIDIGDKRPTMVTATHAIFKEDEDGQKAPAGVVGAQIDYDKFEATFMDHTTGEDGFGFMTQSGEKLSCNNESIECYVLDNNGFVVISEDPFNIGKFFGTVDGTILNSLEQNDVFKKIKVYDYQAVCLENEDDGSPASTLLTPFKLVAWSFNWVLGNIAWSIIHLELHHLWNPDWTYAAPRPQDQLDYAYAYADGDGAYYDDDDDYGLGNGDYGMGDNGGDLDSDEEDDDDDDEPFNEFDETMLDEFEVKDGGFIPTLEMAYINKTQPKTCDKEAYLYELNEERLNKQDRPLQGILRNCHESNCERPFSVTRIPHTNLVLIVADKMCPCYSARISVLPKKVDYDEDEEEYCEKLKHNLYRKKPRNVRNFHPQEEEISLCGGSSSLVISISLFIFAKIFHSFWGQSML